jgi:hypothetical protein
MPTRELPLALGQPHDNGPFSQEVHGVTATVPLRSSFLLSVSAALLFLAGCGGSSTPSPTSTPKPTNTAVSTVVQTVAGLPTARRFLRAFVNGNARVMIALMSPKLLARNRHQFVSQMLGVNGTPGGFTILRAHTFRTRTGRWTRVVARFELDHGATVDRLGLVRRGGVWRVNSIRHVGSVA